MMQSAVRRRDRRWRFILPGIFVAIFLFSFLVKSAKNLDDDAGAASLANFDPGYIISDYQMTNYNSMSEAEIQAFLKSKNSCNDTNLNKYTAGSKVSYFSETYPPYTWHVSDGHFVCLADEDINGETAAHIIYQAAHDYEINPQVLIVLLQKEQGLITDTFPNSFQFRSATGYGCPDTAACSSKYYGFKNQVRNAAAMFRTVLNGGWTNYPLGENYIQYNPNPDCGGSTVNIRNLATSALYRYTPYQPNSGALSAGYGTAYCGAYGNRNFYLYFEDWFSGIKDESAKYIALDVPRYMEVKETVERISSKGEVFDVIEEGRILKFTSKTRVNGNKMCLRTEYATEAKVDACIPIEFLKEVRLEYEMINNNQKKIIKPGAEKIYIRGGKKIALYNKQLIRNIVAKTVFNGKEYYITEYDYDYSGSEYGFLAEYIEDMPDYQELDEVIVMTPVNDAKRIEPVSGEYFDTLTNNVTYRFASYIEFNGVKYYRTEHNTNNKIELAIAEENLEEVQFVNLVVPRYFTLSEDAERVNVATGEVFDVLKKGARIKFSSKIQIDGVWFYRTEHNTQNNYALVINAQYLAEIK